MRRRAVVRSGTIFCAPTTRIILPAPPAYAGSWLPLADTATRAPSSVTAETLPTTKSGAALRRRISSSCVLGSSAQTRGFYSDESARAVDVRFDIGKAQRLAGGGEHRCSIWQEGSYTSAGRLRIVENFDAECVGGECMGGAIDLFGSSRHGELL